MKKVLLSPIEHRDFHTESLEQEINAYFKDVLFDPIVQKFEAAKIRVNSGESALWSAIMDGTVTYRDGTFAGTFSAAISKELRSIGAKRVGTRDFALPPDELPVPLRGAVAHAKHKQDELHAEILAFLLAVPVHIERAPLGIPFTKTVDSVAKDVQQQFTESVAKVEGLAPTSLPEGTVARSAETFRSAAETAIRAYTLEVVEHLRSRTEANRNHGEGAERLAHLVEADFGKAQRKAHFLAENETSRLVAHLAKERFESIGSNSYVWVTQGDAKVRPTHHESNDHRVLNRRVFKWENPPIVDPATGRRAHPGEDYNCRCHAHAVLLVK